MVISGKLAHRIQGNLQNILSYMELETGDFPWLEKAKKEVRLLSTLINSHIRDIENEEQEIVNLQIEVRELKAEIRDLRSKQNQRQ